MSKNLGKSNKQTPIIKGEPTKSFKERIHKKKFSNNKQQNHWNFRVHHSSLCLKYRTNQVNVTQKIGESQNTLTL